MEEEVSSRLLAPKQASGKQTLGLKNPALNGGDSSLTMEIIYSIFAR
jgi:hypothetical protein